MHVCDLRNAWFWVVAINGPGFRGVFGVNPLGVVLSTRRTAHVGLIVFGFSLRTEQERGRWDTSDSELNSRRQRGLQEQQR